MDYDEVLGTARKILRKHKMLLLLCLMAGCINSSGQRNDDAPSGISNFLSDLPGGMLFVLVILSLTLLVLLFVISVYG